MATSTSPHRNRRPQIHNTADSRLSPNASSPPQAARATQIRPTAARTISMPIYSEPQQYTPPPLVHSQSQSPPHTQHTSVSPPPLAPNSYSHSMSRVPPPTYVPPPAMNVKPVSGVGHPRIQSIMEGPEGIQYVEEAAKPPQGPAIERDVDQRWQQPPQRRQSGGSGGAGSPIPSSSAGPRTRRSPPEQYVQSQPDSSRLVPAQQPRQAQSSSSSTSPVYQAPMPTPPHHDPSHIAASPFRNEAPSPGQQSYDSPADPGTSRKTKTKTPDRSFPLQEEGEQEEGEDVTPTTTRDRQRDIPNGSTQWPIHPPQVAPESWGYDTQYHQQQQQQPSQQPQQQQSQRGREHERSYDQHQPRPSPSSHAAYDLTPPGTHRFSEEEEDSGPVTPRSPSVSLPDDQRHPVSIHQQLASDSGVSVSQPNGRYNPANHQPREFDPNVIHTAINALQPQGQSQPRPQSRSPEQVIPPQTRRPSQNGTQSHASINDSIDARLSQARVPLMNGATLRRVPDHLGIARDEYQPRTGDLRSRSYGPQMGYMPSPQMAHMPAGYEIQSPMRMYTTLRANPGMYVIDPMSPQTPHTRPGAPIPPTTAAPTPSPSVGANVQPHAPTPYPYSNYVSTAALLQQHDQDPMLSQDEAELHNLGLEYLHPGIDRAEPIQLIHHLPTDSTFSVSSTPHPGYNYGYNPFLPAHLVRRGIRNGRGAPSVTASMRSSPSHLPIPLETNRRRRGKKIVERQPPRGESTEPRETSDEEQVSEEDEDAEDDLTEGERYIGRPQEAEEDWVDELDSEEEDIDLLEFEMVTEGNERHPRYIRNETKRRRKWEVKFGELVKLFHELDRLTDTPLMLLAVPPAPNRPTPGPLIPKAHVAMSRSIRRSPTYMQHAHAARRSYQSIIRSIALSPPAPSRDPSSASTSTSASEGQERSLSAALRTLGKIYEKRELRREEEAKRQMEEKEGIDRVLRSLMAVEPAAAAAALKEAREKEGPDLLG